MTQRTPVFLGVLIGLALVVGSLLRIVIPEGPVWDTIITIPLLDNTRPSPQPGDRDAGLAGTVDLEDRVLELDQQTRDLAARCLVACEIRTDFGNRLPTGAKTSIVLSDDRAGSTRKGPGALVVPLTPDGSVPGCASRACSQAFSATDEFTLTILRSPRLRARLRLERARSETGADQSFPRLSSRLVLKLRTGGHAHA